jgi:hypothetical protein
MESGSDAVLTVGNPALWIGFTLLVLMLLALDLGVGFSLRGRRGLLGFWSFGFRKPGML